MAYLRSSNCSISQLLAIALTQHRFGHARILALQLCGLVQGFLDEPLAQEASVLAWHERFDQQQVSREVKS